MYSGGILTVMVADFNRSIQFYTETVGLTLKHRYGDGWAEIEAPGLQIGLHPQHGAPTASGASHLSVGLQVDDLEAAMAELEGRGITFTRTQQGEGARFAYFADPDGTTLYLMELDRRYA
jgi:catechol 2,3-dioxygenase-like lactoylglutathione lyase family enzyme